MTAPQIYPLSTQDGKAVPLDVVQPTSLLPITIANGSANDFTIPTGWLLATLYADVDCILRMGTNFPDGVVMGAELTNAIFIPGNTQVDLVLTPGTASVWGVSAGGTLWISAIQQWGALVQPNQANYG